MLKSVPLDILYICAELITGKSLPVLVGLVRLPIGQGLAWLSVTAGALTGTCFSVWAARQTLSLSVPSFADRLLQLSFSLFLSVSHLLALAKGVHPDHGPTLVLIPAFCLVWQPLPQRHSTALVAFLLSWATFYVSGLMTSVDAGVPTTAVTLEEAIGHSRLRHHTDARAHPPQAVATLHQIVLRALQLFALGAYATIQHAPTQVFFDTRHAHPTYAPHHRAHPTYASHHHAKHAPYSLFMGLVAAWLRVCAWTVVCFSQENFLTLMLDTGASSPGSVLRWDWLCCIFYSVTLLYSAAWTATQLREQVLPRFLDPESSHILRLFVLIFALAAIYRQRAPDLMFGATHALTAVSILTALATLKTSGKKEAKHAAPVHHATQHTNQAWPRTARGK
jgi:hypothetical protein